MLVDLNILIIEVQECYIHGLFRHAWAFSSWQMGSYQVRCLGLEAKFIQNKSEIAFFFFLAKILKNKLI